MTIIDTTDDQNADECFEVSHSITDRSHDDSIVGEMRHRTNRAEDDEQIENASDGPERGGRTSDIPCQFTRQTPIEKRDPLSMRSYLVVRLNCP